MIAVSNNTGTVSYLQTRNYSLMAGNTVTRREKAVFWLSVAAYVLFAVVLVSSFTRLHIINGKYFHPRVMMVFFHPRFGVYTRRPGEPIHRLYELRNGQLKQVDVRPFQVQYAFGLQRSYKVIAAEVEALAATPRFFDSAATLSLHNGEQLPPTLVPTYWRTMQNSNVHWLHGQYVITLEPPLAWAKRDDTAAYTIRYVPVNIKPAP
ncbi:MAG: hypothetical protein EBZ77_01300 [Chitinophagia bacterium]|nr:hypothetical protein [Chitinophagia bacterium]